jgi:hypothetical protein
MLNPLYLQLFSHKFGKDVLHILDCAESNFPALSKSKATYFTDRIKMVCPLLFPTAHTEDTASLAEEMSALIQKSSNSFDNIKSLAKCECCGNQLKM